MLISVFRISKNACRMCCPILEENTTLYFRHYLYTFTTETPFNNPDGRLVLKFLLGKLPKGVSVWFDDFFISTKES